jgi:hypothetical protein
MLVFATLVLYFIFLRAVWVQYNMHQKEGHTSAHRELIKQAKCRSSHRKYQRDLRQDLSQQTAVEHHHRTGPTSTEDVCTHVVEQTQGSTWQLNTFLTHRGII